MLWLFMSGHGDDGNCPTCAMHRAWSMGREVTWLTNRYSQSLVFLGLPHLSVEKMLAIWIQNWMWLDSKPIALQSNQAMLRPVLDSHFQVSLRLKSDVVGRPFKTTPQAQPFLDSAVGSTDSTPHSQF